MQERVNWVEAVSVLEGTSKDRAGGALERVFSPESPQPTRLCGVVQPPAQRSHSSSGGQIRHGAGAAAHRKTGHLDLTEAARHWMGEEGYDERFGARPMARVIQEHIKKPLADEILFGRLAQGGRSP